MNFLLNKDLQQKVATILYGRNYIIEPLDVLLNKYQDSMSKGVTTAILDHQLYQIICTLHKNSPDVLEEELKRIKKL